MPMDVPLWNKLDDENISCWACEHFQRYYVQGENLCEGECRKYPPYTSRALYAQGSGAAIGDDVRFPFWLQYGVTQWCSGFQRSLEANIPAPPDVGNCNGPPILAAITPPQYQDINLAAKPFSKKPVEESCWYCQHFQRKIEDLENPYQTPCRGWCRIQPQDSYVDRFLTTTPEDWQSGFVVIIWSTSMWCNRWERSRLPVPAEPDYGQGPCVYFPS